MVLFGLGVFLLAGCGGEEPQKKSKPEVEPEQRGKADSTTSSDLKSHQTKSKPPSPSPAEPAELLRASLDDAVALLRNGEFREFLLRHVPVEELRRLRESQTLDTVASALQSDSDGQSRLRQIYELAAQAELPSSADTGLVELTLILPESHPPKSQIPSLTDPHADSVTLPPGFSDDLSECLMQAADALAGGALPTFISKMLPPSDFRDYAAGPNGLELVQFLGHSPAMVTAMETELRTLAQQTPVLKEDGTVATFEHNGRMIRFELVDGSWRFFDDSLPVRSVLFQQSQQQPADVRVTLRFERIGDDWRAYGWPTELSKLLSPRDESL